MLARTLGYQSAARMLADLTPEEYERWVQSYQQEPWGDAREDQRNAATVLWLRWQPTYEGEKPELPNLHHPYFESEAEKKANEVEEYKKLKARAIEHVEKLKAKRGH